MNNIAQFSEFKAKVDIKLGRRIIKKDDLFLVTSPKHSNGETVKIERKKRARLNEGTLVCVVAFLRFFEPVELSK